MSDNDRREQDLRESLQKYIDSSNDSQAKIAKALGISPGALSQFLNGKYATPHAILPKIEAFLSVQHDRSVAPKEPGFVVTSIASDVTKVIRVCHIQSKIGVVYGDAGVGKTITAKEYLNQFPDAIFITIDEMYASKNGINELLAEELRISGSSSRKIYREILTKLNGSGRVIIVDEAQHLTQKSLDHIRAFHDKSGVGIVLIGNEEVYKRMIGRGQAAFAQLFSRMAMRLNVNVTSVKPEDIKLLFPTLEEGESGFLLKIAQSRWGLRGAVNVFTLALSNSDLTNKGLKAAAKFMGIGA